MSIPNFINSAEELLGKELNGGWKVVEKIEAISGETGGYFSRQYIVERGGQKAFLKALDYSRLINSLSEMRIALSEFDFERNILEICKSLKLNRVVRSLDYGEYTAEGSPYPANYFIFELAKFNVRKFMMISSCLDKTWILRTAHQIAAGLNQLHTNGIAHQDLKPSNVLLFEQGIAKICDLGRSTVNRDKVEIAETPHEYEPIPGDRNYAPPEFLYRTIPSKWESRRLAYDFYHLGNIIFFFFTQSNLTAEILSRLDSSLHYDNYNGSYNGVLPYVIHEFNIIMLEFEKQLPTKLKEPIIRIVRQMCDPDPNRRGHPKDRGNLSRQYSLQRYVSELDLLASNLEVGIINMED